MPWKFTGETKIKIKIHSLKSKHHNIMIKQQANFETLLISNCRSQWPRGLRCRSAATRLLRSWVWIPPRAWMFVCCECCVLSGRGLCDELIAHSEESYRLCCVIVCDLENLTNEEAMIHVGLQCHRKKKVTFIYSPTVLQYIFNHSLYIGNFHDHSVIKPLYRRRQNSCKKL